VDDGSCTQNPACLLPCRKSGLSGRTNRDALDSTNLRGPPEENERRGMVSHGDSFFLPPSGFRVVIRFHLVFNSQNRALGGKIDQSVWRGGDALPRQNMGWTLDPSTVSCSGDDDGADGNVYRCRCRCRCRLLSHRWELFCTVFSERD